MNARLSNGMLALGLALLGIGVTTALAQQPPRNDPDNGYAPPRPAARGAATPPSPDALPAPEPAAGNTPDTPVAQQEREWLVAYLIAHQGYRIDQMDALEKRIDRMSPTQVQTLVDIYKQKHELALKREASYHQMRSQTLAAQTADYNQRLQQEQANRQAIDASANAEQQRLNQQQQQAAQNVEQNQLFHQQSYGNSANPYFGGYYYDRYWH